MGERVVKVICQTCYTEHPFMEGKEKKKAPKAGSSAFKQVLDKVAPAPAAEAPADEEPKQKKAKPRARYISRRKTTPPGGKK